MLDCHIVFCYEVGLYEYRPMKLSKLERENLVRFGCTLKPGSQFLYVALPQNRIGQAATCDVELQPLYFSCGNAAFLCLAFEISSVRLLPHYCYFPFDLKKRWHKKFLAVLLKRRMLELVFVSGRKRATRQIALSKQQLSLIRTNFDLVCKSLKDSYGKKYDFEKALVEFEGALSLSFVFARLLSKRQFAQFAEQFRLESGKVPIAKRAESRKVVEAFFDLFEKKLPSFYPAVLQSLPTFWTYLFLVTDTIREFTGDQERLRQFLEDAIACHSTGEEIQELGELPKRIEEYLIPIALVGSAVEEKRAELGPEMAKALEVLRQGHSLTLPMVKKLLPLAGIPLGGRRGRKPKDYSREYEWKQSGLSWSEVTIRAMEAEQDLKEEFQGRRFDKLDYRQQESLMKRIQEGVKSFAHRTRKPFPIIPSLTSPSEGNEKGKELPPISFPEEKES